ncbi:MAG: dTMP kinase [Oscillospiraceae bacterium]
MNKGKIIVLEGLDGCGKSTQLQLAADELLRLGLPVKQISFPDYESDSGKIVTRYLNGDIPCDGTAGAYAASSFYAIDRYISYNTSWKQDYDNGSIIICGRYTTSNAVYQMTKLNSEEEKMNYLNWLWDYEYNKLGLPRPDAVLFLDMPIEVSQKLLSARYGGDDSKKDIHERNLAFMRECRDSALLTAKLDNWKMIPCSDGDAALPIEQIHRAILSVIKEYINE